MNYIYLVKKRVFALYISFNLFMQYNWTQLMFFYLCSFYYTTILYLSVDITHCIETSWSSEYYTNNLFECWNRLWWYVVQNMPSTYIIDNHGGAVYTNHPWAQGHGWLHCGYRRYSILLSQSIICQFIQNISWDNVNDNQFCKNTFKNYSE